MGRWTQGWGARKGSTQCLICIMLLNVTDSAQYAVPRLGGDEGSGVGDI